MNDPTEVQELERHGLLDVAKDVAARYHLTLDELLGRSRSQHEANARRVLWGRAYELVPSFFQLARIFGRNHATIRYAVQGRKGKRRCDAPRRVDLSGCDAAERDCLLVPHTSKIATCETASEPAVDEPW